mgnify:CR=1 FL=1
MKNIPSLVQSLSLTLILALGSVPVISWAADTDPDGVKLMLLREDPNFKADLKEKTGDAANSTNWRIVCALEAATVVGLTVWDARRTKDECWRFASLGAPEYCLDYSQQCDHYHWDASCLLDKNGADFCKGGRL